jgi:hypothetical protein
MFIAYLIFTMFISLFLMFIVSGPQLPIAILRMICAAHLLWTFALLLGYLAPVVAATGMRLF